VSAGGDPQRSSEAGLPAPMSCRVMPVPPAPLVSFVLFALF
jgi:hypothetical protein